MWRMSGGLVEGRRCLLHHLTLPHELVLCSRGDEMKTRNKHFHNILVLLESWRIPCWNGKSASGNPSWRLSDWRSNVLAWTQRSLSWRHSEIDLTCITCLNLAGNFQWAEANQTAEYVNWSSSQPDNASNEDCVFTALRNAGNIGVGWNDYACESKNYHGVGIFALCMMK